MVDETQKQESDYYDFSIFFLFNAIIDFAPYDYPPENWDLWHEKWSKTSWYISCYVQRRTTDMAIGEVWHHYHANGHAYKKLK